jgi:hypothetical protein
MNIVKVLTSITKRMPSPTKKMLGAMVHSAGKEIVALPRCAYHIARDRTYHLGVYTGA